MVKKVLGIFLKVLKFIWNIVKHILLFYLYSTSIEKYNITYDEWLKGNDK